jgi:hypothetical protein
MWDKVKQLISNMTAAGTSGVGETEKPNKLDLQEAIKKAIEGKLEVVLYIKGWRPMTPWKGVGKTNYLHIEGYECDSPYHGVPKDISITRLCHKIGVDPELVDLIYLNYADPDGARSIITNLLPFPLITWIWQDGQCNILFLKEYFKHSKAYDAHEIDKIIKRCKYNQAAYDEGKLQRPHPIR